MSYQIKIPSCIFGGAGSIENVKAVIEKENAKKVIIFTDKGIRSTGLLDLLTDILEENKTEYQVFDDLACEPSYQDVEKVMKEVENTSGDLIIAIGGGSVMDAAKLCCVLKDCHLIGKPLTTEILISGDFPEIEQEMELQVLDITRRPEYGILDKQVAIARQQVKLNHSELLPKVGIKGSYDYVHGLELNEKNFLDNASFSVLLNVSIPLFHFGERSNKVRAAKARLEQTRLQQQNLNEQMLLELTQAANNLDEAKLESELADRSLWQAEENRRVSKSQYEVGLETLSDHLEAQALWQQAYETQVDARFQLYLNYVAYLKAAGTLHDKL